MLQAMGSSPARSGVFFALAISLGAGWDFFFLNYFNFFRPLPLGLGSGLGLGLVYIFKI